MKLNEAMTEMEALRDRVVTAQAALDTAKQELAEFEVKCSKAEIIFPGAEPDASDASDVKKVEAKVTKPEKAVDDTVTSQSRKNASDGRNAVASGERPPLKKAMIMVMGTDVMNAGGILAALEARGWAPASNDPHQYVSFMLSSNSTVFERTEKRGHYRVRSDYLSTKETDKKGNGTKGEKKASPNPDIDQKLQDDFGVTMPKPGNVAVDPYDS